MKFLKVLALGSFAFASLFLTSCGCCTGEETVPGLRPLPELDKIPVYVDVNPSMPVEPTK